MHLCKIKEFIECFWHEQIIVTHEHDIITICRSNQVTKIFIEATIHLILDVIHLILCLGNKILYLRTNLLSLGCIVLTYHNLDFIYMSGINAVE